MVAGLMVLSLFVGAYDITEKEFGTEMFFISRVPRTVALVLAGCAMSVSGLIMQMLTRNRFVEPTTTGTTEWAALGLLLTVLIAPGANIATKMVTASLAAFVGTMIFLAILRRVALRSSLVVPLIGIMLGAVVSAFTTYLAVSTNLLQMLGTWFMGSFTGVVRGRYEILWLVAVIVALAYVAGPVHHRRLGGGRYQRRGALPPAVLRHRLGRWPQSPPRWWACCRSSGWSWNVVSLAGTTCAPTCPGCVWAEGG